MNKNKILHRKNIFKTYLKIEKNKVKIILNFQTNFNFIKH